MQAFMEIFMFGTVWYFLVTAAWMVAILWCVEKESPLGSGIWLILYLCFLQFLAKVNFFDQIIHHPASSALWVLGYFIAGFLWSFVKWWLYVHKKAEKFSEARCQFLKDHQNSYNRKSVSHSELKEITLDTKVPESLMDEWKNHIKLYGTVPKVRENKGKISMWVTYWPASMVWSVVNDFVKKFIRAIVMKCRKIYEGITKSAFKGLDVPPGVE
jgi:hypothetical protein